MRYGKFKTLDVRPRKKKLGTDSLIGETNMLLFPIALHYIWVKANGKRPTGILELCVSSYPDTNISDGNLILVPQFSCTQKFQIDLVRPK